MGKIIRKKIDWLTLVVKADRGLIFDPTEIESRRDHTLLKLLKLSDEDLKGRFFGNFVYRDEITGVNAKSHNHWFRIDMPGSSHLTKGYKRQREILRFITEKYGIENINITRLDYAIDFEGEDPLNYIEVIKVRNPRFATSHWRSGFFNNCLNGSTTPGTVFQGFKSKMLKVYNKSQEINSSGNLVKKKYYNEIFQERDILRAELSFRSKDYFQDGEIKGKILSGKFDEVGKELFLYFLERHKIETVSGRECPKYKRLLKVVKSI